jgi:hypothetical protein
METELQKRQKEVVLDALKHYNLHNRGIRNGYCSYGAGCAVGRRLNQELADKLDLLPGAPYNVSCFEVFELLPESEKELGAHFLLSLQTLHDDAMYWDNEGLKSRYFEDVKRLFSRWVTLTDEELTHGK